MPRTATIKIIVDGNGISSEIKSELSVPEILIAFAQLQEKLIKGDFKKTPVDLNFQPRKINEEIK